MTADDGRALWDTSVVIAPPAAATGSVAVSVVTVMELYSGVNATADPRRRADRLALLGAVLSTFDLLPVDTAVAEAFARVDAAARTTGRTSRRRLADLQIAATALAHRLPLLTRNPQDLAGLDELVDVVAVR